MILQGSQKKSNLEITLLLLIVCYYTSGNLNELNINNSLSER